MNFAVGLALVAAAINFTTGVVAWSIRRAHDWHTARVASGIALAGGLYNLCSLLLALDGLDQTVYLGASRAAYLVATLMCTGWLVFAHMPAGASGPVWSRPMRGVAIGALGLAVVVGVTGIHLRPEISIIEVPWAGVRYHYAVTTPFGDLYGLLVVGLLAAALWRLLTRIRSGESSLTPYVVGFGIFFACAVVEVLVANRVVTFLSLADAGFAAAVVPMSIQLVRRVISDANRLAELTRRLEGDVEVRTLERDEARAALAAAERLAALGRLAAGVGHEINNPLTYVQGALAELEEGLAGMDVPSGVATAVRRLHDGAARIEKTVDGLRSHAGTGETRAPLDLREVVQSARRLAGPNVPHRVELRVELGAPPAVLGSEPQLVQAIVNLIVNAGQAIAAGRGTGAVTVRTGALEDGQAFVSVTDDGPGIAAEHLTYLCEPYYTTNANLGGLGLGLFVTRGIVARHGGRLDVTSSVGHGTTFTFTLPAARSESAPSPVVARKVPDAANVAATMGTLLLIDDDDLVRDVLCAALRKEWRVTAVASAADALALLETATFDAIVCDLMMPGMTGIEFDQRLAERWPELRPRTLFLTGGAIAPNAEQFLARADVRHLVKPVTGRKLSTALAELVRLPEAGAPSA